MRSGFEHRLAGRSVIPAGGFLLQDRTKQGVLFFEQAVLLIIRILDIKVVVLSGFIDELEVTSGDIGRVGIPPVFGVGLHDFHRLDESVRLIHAFHDTSG